MCRPSVSFLSLFDYFSEPAVMGCVFVFECADAYFGPSRWPAFGCLRCQTGMFGLRPAIETSAMAAADWSKTRWRCYTPHHCEPWWLDERAYDYDLLLFFTTTPEAAYGCAWMMGHQAHIPFWDLPLEWRNAGNMPRRAFLRITYRNFRISYGLQWREVHFSLPFLFIVGCWSSPHNPAW